MIEEEQIQFARTEISAYQKSKEGNSCCGDSYFMHETEDYFICAVADGLGSGIEAQASSISAIKVVESHHDEDVKFIMDKCNEALRNKRGAVLAIFKVYFNDRQLEYCCVGNIRFIVYSPTYQLTYPLPTSGFLSGRPQMINVKRFSFEPGSSFFIYSDGLNVRSAKDLVGNIASPEHASAEIKQLIGHPKDDVTFLVGKINE